MIIVWILVALAGCVAVGVGMYIIFLWWGLNWGSTEQERQAPMAGDKYLGEGPRGRRTIVMTRAISIAAPPETVWAWLAQIGRGAGYYSMELLDNGGKKSACHIVSWIPEPCLGDCVGPGYIAHLEPGREFVIFLPGQKEFGIWGRLTGDYLIAPEGDGTRLVCRIVGEAIGWNSFLYKWLFGGIDTLMSWRQLVGIKKRAEAYGMGEGDDASGETGARDQYQAFEVFYASGGSAGIPGKSTASKWHATAEDDFGELYGKTSGSLPAPPHPLDKEGEVTRAP